MKRSAIGHPKLTDLCAALRLRKWEAIGILESLWLFTARFAPQGDIGKFSDAAIAKGLDWNRDQTRLISALVETRWLDRCECHRLLVHDWADHADQQVKRLLASKNLAFIQHLTSAKNPAGENHASPPLPLPVPEPKPEPKPANLLPDDGTVPVNGGSRFKADRQSAWEQAIAIYPGELKPEWDAGIFVSCVQTFEDIRLLSVNTPLWTATRKWKDGFAPSFENYLKKRQFKTAPKPDQIPQERQGTVYQEWNPPA